MQVINSCNTHEQLKSAQNFINLYSNKFEDLLGTGELERELNGKIESLL
jgi:hypothetical protein